MEQQGISNFTNSSFPHRLPTISASEALQNASARTRAIPTGLPSLDSALQANNSTTSSKGLPRGSVTEVYGPPGVGKTTFAMQVAVNALHSPSAHHGVVWIDTGAPLPGPRFKQIFAAYKSPLIPAADTPPSRLVPKPSEKMFDNISYFNVPTLAHLLTFFLHPTPEFPPPHTSLIVIDNVSTVFATAFTRSADRRAAGSTPTAAESARNVAQQKAASRKWAVAGDLAAAMMKMASLHDLGVLVINQVATSIKGVRKAVLKPSLSGNGWDAGVQNQILLYRDFAPQDGTVELTVKERRAMRFAEAVKISGKVATATTVDVVPFVIEDQGLRELRVTCSPEAAPVMHPAAPKGDGTLKRKADEIADSEGDEDEVGSDDDLEFRDEFLADGCEQYVNLAYAQPIDLGPS